MITGAAVKEQRTAKPPTDELAGDYRSFLIHRGLRVWHKESPEARAMRARLKHDIAPDLPPAPEGAVRLTGLAGLSSFVGQATPELAANALLCAVNQAAFLLRRQLERQGRDFAAQGGFTEHLHALHTQARAGTPRESDESDGSDKAAAPVCPLCGKGMRRRVAKRGPHAGQAFWGCSGYPACRGTRPTADVEGGPAP